MQSSDGFGQLWVLTLEEVFSETQDYGNFEALQRYQKRRDRYPVLAYPLRLAFTSV